MHHQVSDLYSNTDIMAALPHSLLKELVACARSVTLKKGETLFHEGDDASGFFMLREGSLKATRVSPEGEEQLIAIFRPGEMIGEMGIFENAPRSATIAALRPSMLVRWDAGKFFELADSRPELYRFIITTLSRRLRQMNNAVAARQFLPLKGQLAQALLRISSAFGEEQNDGSIIIGTKLTQSDLAAMIGASRENVSRQLKTWEREGLLAKLDGRYQIVDPDLLEDSVEGLGP